LGISQVAVSQIREREGINQTLADLPSRELFEHEVDYVIRCNVPVLKRTAREPPEMPEKAMTRLMAENRRENRIRQGIEPRPIPAYFLAIRAGCRNRIVEYHREPSNGPREEWQSKKHL
jgi:hypothetical protein